MGTSIYQSIPVDILKEGTKRNVDSSSECMKYQFFRLSSFESFPPKSDGRPLKLAKAGFLFTPRHPEDDTVTCFSCQTTRNNWTRFDDPMEIHQSLNPDCEFIKGTSGNVEIAVPKDDVCQKIKAGLREKYSGRNEARERSPQISTNVDPRSSESPRSNQRSLSDSLSGPGIIPVIPPVHRRPQLTTDGATDPLDRSQMLINESTNNASIVLAADISRNTMVREEARLRTFTHWPRNLMIRPPALARVGFYYLGSSDRVQCAFCKGILRDWDEAESPVAEHWRYFSNCRFMRGLDDRNIPLIPGDTFVSDYVTAHPQDSNSDDQTSPGNPLATILNKGNVKIALGKETATAEDLGIITETASFPDQAILATRLGSFSKWPRGHSPPSKDVLAEAGFFYTGREDAVKCFFCGGCLKSWENSDIPWEEHARWFPKCSYLIRIKGQKFVDAHRKPDEGTAQMAQPKAAKGQPINCRNLSLDDLMNLPIVREALGFGLDESRIRQVVEMKSRNSESFFTSCHEIINAVLDLDSDSKFKSEVEKKPEVPSTQLSPVFTKESEHVEGNGDVEPEVENKAMSKLKRENEELREQRLCKICMDAEANIVILPCGHFAACSSCAVILTKCPLCREDVKGTVKTFMP